MKIKQIKTYTISQFAELINVSTQTLRNWDKKKIFVANRTPSNFRYYTPEHYEIYIKQSKGVS